MDIPEKDNMKKGIILISAALLLVSGCSKKILPAADTNIVEQGNDAQYNYLFSEAIRQKYLGSVDNAVKLFQECTKRNPSAAAPYYEMAQIAAFQGDKQSAKINALKAFRNEKDNYWINMFCGGLYAGTGNLDSAVVFMENASRLRPDDYDSRAALGQIYLQQGDIVKAERVLKQLRGNSEYDENDIYNIVNSLISTKHFREAEDWTKSLINRNTEEVKYRAVLAEIYRYQGLNAKADSIYNSIIANNPDDGESQILVMNYLVEKEDYENASSFLGSIMVNNDIKRERKVEFLKYLLSDSTFVKKESKVLESNLTGFEKQYPGDEEINSLRAGMYESLGLNEEAIERYREIRKTNPETFYSDQRLIILLAETKKYEELFNVARDFATEYNKSLLGKVYYGIAAMELKKYEIADAEFDKAMILAGNDSKMQFSVLSAQADLAYREKNFPKAYSVLEQALKIEPDDAGTLNNYAYYLAENNDSLKLALNMATKAIKKEPEMATYIDTYGWVLYKMGKYRPSLKFIDKALELSKERDPELLEHKGYILKALHKYSEAVIFWKEDLSQDPSKTYLNDEINKCVKKQ